MTKKSTASQVDKHSL